MPDVTEVKAFYNRKVQLERYEPVQHGVELTVQVEEDEDWQDVYGAAAMEAEAAVEEELARRVAATKMEDDEED